MDSKAQKLKAIVKNAAPKAQYGQKKLWMNGPRALC
jgi:hypothetical protein